MSLFRLAQNISGVTQIIYRDTMDTISIPPGFVADLSNCLHNPPGFKPVDNFLKLVESMGLRRFFIQRRFAYGDNLMAVPVVRHLRTLGLDVRFRTSSEFVSIMEKLVPTEDSMNHMNRGEIGLLMDWVLERDHGESKLNPLHRVEIYFQALGMESPDPSELDWEADLNCFPPNPISGKEPYVVFQGHGANRNKQLPVDTIAEICRSLNAKGIKVYYTGNPDFSGLTDLTTHTKFRWSKAEMFPAIAGSVCLITMDSAPLWISHLTRTPVICVLGPTGTEKHRLSFHPLYPEGATALKMNEWIKCPTCFEKASACNQTMRCLNSNKEKLIEEVTENVMRFWESENEH